MTVTAIFLAVITSLNNSNLPIPGLPGGKLPCFKSGVFGEEWFVPHAPAYCGCYVRAIMSVIEGEVIQLTDAQRLEVTIPGGK